MSVKRYEPATWDMMDEHPEGNWVMLEDIIEIIERCPRIDNDHMIQCDARHLIALIKGKAE